MAIAPSISQATDDVGPQTGAVYYGDYTNDTAPLLTVKLGDQAAAGDTLVVQDAGASLTSVTLSADEVAAGKVDVQLSGLADGWHTLRVALTANGADKIASSNDWALGVETHSPAAPVIRGGSDNYGAATGQVADGGRTDDATLTFTLHEDGLPPMPTTSPGHAPYGGPALMSGHVDLYEGANLVGRASLGYDVDVTITASGLSEGDHVLTAVAVDRAGNVSAASQPFHVTIGADQTTAVTTTGSGGDTSSTGGTSSGGGTSGGSGSAVAGETLTASDAGGTLQGGTGDDTIKGGGGQDYLRGGEGSDQMTGGDAFDDMNGNQGDDTLSGGLGGDWVVGGRDDDHLSGDEGNDVVYGNIGADWADGGAGDDIVRGGQDDDVLFGGAGADWLSGDKGSDTITGGAGADIFHTWADAGIDRITDFNAAEGDRVMVDAGTSYTYAQVGADTVITMGSAQMVLVGVQASTLTSGWIFAG